MRAGRGAAVGDWEDRWERGQKGCEEGDGGKGVLEYFLYSIFGAT